MNAPEPDTPVTCPRCEKLMQVVRRGVNGEFISYRCVEHGIFYIDSDGQLRPSGRFR